MRQHLLSARHKLVVGIQARSTSSRLPRKHHEMIGHKRLLDHVIDTCKVACYYVNHKVGRDVAEVALLTPMGDPIGVDFAKHDIPMIYGPEDDVLKRYHLAAERLDCTAMIRVTGDCPLLPAYVISKIAIHGLSNRFDYLSNVDPECRTSADGTDVEFLSRRMLEWMHAVAREPYDREHVTPLARSAAPKWSRRGAVVNWFDASFAAKVSVDTEEDLERVRQSFADVQRKMGAAIRVYGRSNIMRL